MELKDYPKKLLENRKEIECNFIFCLWKEPDLIDDYANVVNGKDILTQDGIFYYGLAQQMNKAGYKVFDNMSVVTFLADKPVLQKGFEERTGFVPIKEITELLDSENMSTYYEALVKSNMVLNLYSSGFDVLKDYDKIQTMNSEELYDYYDYKLNNVCVGKIQKLQAVDLKTGYQPYVKKWDSGESVGFKIGYPLLNYTLAGVHRKNLLLHLGHIGKGKTTTAINMYILPAIEEGENVCIIANEQDENEWRQMVLSTVVFNHTEKNGDKLNRQRFILGNFTDADKERIKKGEEWLQKQKGKLIFISLNDYAINHVKKIIKKYSKRGFTEFIFDTMKPEKENSDKAWAEFDEVAKQLFLLSKKENVAIIATAQLSADSMSRRYLDLTCTGKGRGISETASTVIMFRELTTYEKEKLQAFQRVKDESGKYSHTKKMIPLDVNKNYIVVFIPKNRFGTTDNQILYERNLSFNTMKEIGYVDIPYDGFNKRK